MSFNPKQPRDKHGRWVPGSIVRQEGKKPKWVARKGHSPVSRKIAAAKYGPHKPRAGRPAWPKMKPYTEPVRAVHKRGLVWLKPAKSFVRSVPRDKPEGRDYINVN